MYGDIVYTEIESYVYTKLYNYPCLTLKTLLEKKGI